eukprot:TRINITY_DN6334_c0_g1_i1.p1 TRINITY_DN6334_c0_g1~~TRINITY_DN6334_c0_g1_i1.p1  ORF type:complete len:315 (+),score=53.63 TRINITY_DN6334_c0_g1_i1:120-947(+)
MATDDGKILSCNTLEGSLKRELSAEKYGVRCIKFTHHPSTVVTATNFCRYDNAIRYHSLHDNVYIREYKGHSQQVLSLSVSPIEDLVVSASYDGSIRFWDLRTSVCQAVLHDIGRFYADYNPEGNKVAVAAIGGIVKIFDTRALMQGPINTTQIQTENINHWNGIQFSNNEKYMLCTTESNAYLVDSSNGVLLRTFPLRTLYRNQVGCCISSDESLVLCGSEEGKVNVYNIDIPDAKMMSWQGNSGPISCVKWNPKYNTFISCSTEISFWIPKIG